MTGKACASGNTVKPASWSAFFHVWGSLAPAGFTPSAAKVIPDRDKNKNETIKILDLKCFIGTP
jgi:hypothetical protein